MPNYERALWAHGSKPKLIGTETLDKTQKVLGDAWQGARTVQNWKDPGDVLAAGTARTIEGGLKGIGALTQLPVAKQVLDLADKPVQWIGDKGGEYLESKGYDPRFAHIAARGADMLWGGGVAKGGKALAKMGIRKGAKKARTSWELLTGGGPGTGAGYAAGAGRKYDDLTIQKWADTQKQLTNLPQNEIDELRNLTWQLPDDKIMLPKEVKNRGLAITTQRMLSDKDAKIIQRKEYFDKLYDKSKSGVPLSGSDKAAFANAKKAFKDEVASPVAPLIARWVGNFGIRAYGLTGKAVKGVRQLGHKVKRNTGIDLDQHHGFKSTEGFEFATQEALLLDSTFRVNTHQYLASKGMVPGHSAWNMWMMPNKPHLQELHPWLREMGFETYWKNIDKAVGRNNPTLFYEYIDQFFDEVFTPSLVKAEELMKKGATQYMSITPDKIILPPHVQKLMDKKKQSLLEQAMQSYTKDLKIKGAQSLPRSEINRSFQESPRRI